MSGVQGFLSEAFIAIPDSVGSTGTNNFDALADPIEVIRWGFVAATNVVSGSIFALAMNKRVTAGTDTGALSAVGGTITMATNPHDPFTVAGKMLFTKPLLQLIVLPGEQVQIEVTNAASSGTAYYFMQYQKLPYQKLSGFPLMAGLPIADQLTNMTEIA